MSEIIVRYTTTHEWIKPDGDVFVVGITQHAEALLGDIVFIELPPLGHVVQQGEVLGVIESVKAASDFYAPMSGTVEGVNTQASENPGLINQSPENSGWLVKLRVNHRDEFNALLAQEAYMQQIGE